MLSKIATIMYGEHAIIVEGAQIALSLDRTWKDNADDYERNLKSMLDFFAEYADRYHHYKEEEVLFPALQKTEEPAVMAIVSELLEHHDQFRDLVGKIRNDLSKRDYQVAQNNLKIYIDDLLNHIAAENEELFPMADTFFNKDELESLYYKCIDIDNRLGKARKEELENFILKFNFDEAAK